MTRHVIGDDAVARGKIFILQQMAVLMVMGCRRVMADERRPLAVLAPKYTVFEAVDLDGDVTPDNGGYFSNFSLPSPKPARRFGVAIRTER